MNGYATKDILGVDKKEVLCKNCKWARKDRVLNIISLGLSGWEYALCTNPTLEREIDLVAGKQTPSFCSVNRLYRCGKEGKYWEARKL